MREGYEAFNRGDVDAAFKDFAPEFECDMSRAVGFNVDRDIYDLAQFRRLFDEYVGNWQAFQLGPDESSTLGITSWCRSPTELKAATGSSCRAAVPSCGRFTTEPSSVRASTKSATKPSKPPGSE